MESKESPKKNTIPDDATGLTIRYFVYGTLKRGCWNHDRYCRGVLAVEDAAVRGRLFEMDSGIPVLQVPEEDILAHGTAEPRADVATQARFQAEMAQHPDLRGKAPTQRGWGLVHGELMTFDDPEERLPRLDRLEGFHPGGSSLYRRVLVPVFTGDKTVPAWAYVTEGRVRGKFLPAGVWPA